MDYTELDRMDDYEDTLLALASYDWFYFHDNRINGLKKDYNLKLSNNDIFVYYHGKNEIWHKLNNDRYVAKYKIYLSTMIYA